MQEHGVDRNAIAVHAASDANTAGTEAARADIEDGHLNTGTEGEPALAGAIKVSAEVDEAMTETVLTSFKTYDGRTTSS